MNIIIIERVIKINDDFKEIEEILEEEFDYDKIQGIIIELKEKENELKEFTNGSLVYLAREEISGKYIGYAHILYSNTDINIERIYVRESYRRNGVCNKLLDFIISIANKQRKFIRLETLKSHIIYDFYIKKGFYDIEYANHSDDFKYNEKFMILEKNI